jgi:hypothetical protein
MDILYVTPTAAFVILSLVAAGGLLMLGILLARLPIPSLLGALHGLGGLIGVAALYVAFSRTGFVDKALWPLGFLTAALVGGVVLFKLLFKQARPLVFVLGHGGLAATGLYLLYTLIWAA